ncbi:MAG: VWA domain-containing protein [Clostridiales bacterium]|nr:VWA domain-containing protein [Clostridiales bacterium]
MLYNILYKCKALKVMFLFLLTMLFIFPFAIVVFAENQVTVHTGYNIVFVVDNSTSLDNTDPAHLRKAGLTKILSWLPGTRSQVGLVVFSTDSQAYKDNLQLIEDKNDILDFFNHLPEVTDGWTNITVGLSAAISYINDRKGTDPDLHNLIVLFSDGNIEFADKTEVEPSREEMLQLAKEAKDNEIEIAAIALNNNGEANLSDMKSISSPDLFIEVTSANDLEYAFAQLHQSKFKADTTQLEEGVNKFWVKFGSSALNLNFEPQSTTDDFILISPLDKQIYTKDSPEVYRVGNTYMLNLIHPIYGEWKCEITGGTGTGVTTAPDDFLTDFLGSLIAPVPSTIITTAVELFITSVVTKRLKSRSGRIAFILLMFLLASLIVIAVNYGGSLFQYA